MWLLTFALFTAYGVISGDPDICAVGRHATCFNPPVKPFDFPDNIEDLDKICPIILTRLSCLVDFKNQCGNDFPGSIDNNLDQLYELISDACDKDSELHQELTIRLPCLAGIMMSHRNTCQPIVEDAMEVVKSRILKSDDSENTVDPGDSRRYYCLSEALDLACLLADASVTCGSATKQLVGTVVDRVGFMESVCNADIRDEVKEMVSVMQVEMEQGIAFKNLISNA